MKLSQRLTRAGLAFILFGSIAAVMPQQSGAASADNSTTCNTAGHSFNISNKAGAVQNTYALPASQTDTYTSKLDGTASGSITATNNGPTNAATSSTAASNVTVEAPASGTGTVSLTATTNDDKGVTYNADATISY